ncbi:hypothetical protein [Enteractinococcus coprophilus]|uniref:DUF4345 domain-containing protein n=1 Tax=Enteractinococcus coprophilus TaxID=1027633 RepID=A0A543A090_9MICC|nr:hypothetical protein [Enteractinococcus coprophilus]TQL66007.1 hypothetical protein FB556_2484 [Enteractinococcus coprophilus]
MRSADQPRNHIPHQKILSVFLLVIAIVNVISCAAGAWGIATAGPQLFGADLLAGTLFEDQYWLAALALAFVGLVQILALIAHLSRSRWVATLHAFAGMTMVVFIFVEVLIINETFFLQPLFFGLGALQLSLSPLFWQLLPRRWPAREWGSSR